MRLALAFCLFGAATAAAQVSAVQAGPSTFLVSGTIPGAQAVSVAYQASPAFPFEGVLCDRNGSFALRILVSTPAPLVVTPHGGGGPTVVQLPNAPPGITFGVSQPRPGVVRLTGVVTDEAAFGMTVTFSGPRGIAGNTATVWPGGVFALELAFADALTPVTASVVDWYGLRASRTFP